MTQAKKHSPDPSLEAGCTVAIAGLGLLGASLAKRLSSLANKPRIIGYARRPETVQTAIKDGIIDYGSTEPADILPSADITVLCIPVSAIIRFVEQHAELWQAGAVVTDVGSIKSQIVDAAGPCLAAHGVHFVGSHPMAGSEQTGLENADADLYQGATVFLTPVDSTPSAALQRIERLWHLAGAATHIIAAGKHDALVARTSHLLHLLAAVAVQVGLDNASDVLATAGGFRDFTRIASSSPDMWRQIFELNCDELLHAEEEFSGQLQALRKLMERGQWQQIEEYLAKARQKRAEWQRTWSDLRGLRE